MTAPRAGLDRAGVLAAVGDSGDELLVPHRCSSPPRHRPTWIPRPGLRRMRDQADQSSQFYLYRVRLEPSVVVRDGWVVDPGGLVGDVALDEVCPPGVDVARYLNYHEDPGGLPLALGRDAIAGVRAHCGTPGTTAGSATPSPLSARPWRPPHGRRMGSAGSSRPLRRESWPRRNSPRLSRPPADQSPGRVRVGRRVCRGR